MSTFRFIPTLAVLFVCFLFLPHAIAKQVPAEDLFAATSDSQTFEFVCPEPVKKQTSWLTGLTSFTKKLDKPVSEKRLSSIKVNALGLEVKMLDANPQFLPGNEDAWNAGNGVFPTISGPQSIDQVGFAGMLKMLKDGEERIGVAADGTSQLLIAVRSNIAGTFKAKMLAQSIGDVYPETGEIQMLGGGKTCFTGEDHVAFALYHAPADFGRAGMDSDVRWIDEEKRLAEARTVWLDVDFTTESGAVLEDSFELKVVRPPVVLVHGLFDSGAGAWMTKSERAKRHEEELTAKTLPELLEKSGFVPFVVDYENTNGRAGQTEKSSFWSNRYVVWNNGFGSFFNPILAVLQKDGDQVRSGGIRQALNFYRKELKVAATRADVIGHSMGGILSRVYASDWNPNSSDKSVLATLAALNEGQCSEKGPYNPDYRRPDNFGQGDINRLITLGTPHHGSEAPEVFDLLSRKDLVDEGIQSKVSRTIAAYGTWVLYGKDAGSAAGNDLVVESCALRRIGPTHIKSHVIVGVASGGNLEDPGYGSYLLELEAMAALIYYNPDLGEELVRLVAKDYSVPKWSKKIPTELLRELETVINSEYERWIELEKNFSPSWLTGEPTQKTYRVPTVVIEAIRGLIFRFDKNDATVRVDSQTAGLDIDSPYVTYVASGRDAKLQQNVLHSFEPRYPIIQDSIVKLLWSNPDNNFIDTLPPAGQKMEPHAPPEDFGVDLRLTGSFAKKWSGMDFRHADAFLKVAKKHKVVILGRPVNPDATELILRGSATKGMNVKGKSSNWGPQKGYIPVDQRYSKLWRTSAASDRDTEVEKFNKKTKALLRAVEPSYNTEEDEPIAIGRQLKHSWDGQSYSVWVNPEEADAEKSIYLCKGEPANSDSVAEYGRDKARPVEGEDEEQAKAREKALDEEVGRERQALENPCGCQEWYDWHTGSNGFDIKSKPTKSVKTKNCDGLRPLQVLADNTHPDKEFLTADYDLLTTGFLCPQEAETRVDPTLYETTPEGKNGPPINQCEAKLKVNTAAAVKTKKDPKDPTCVEGLTEVEAAKYSEGTPPKPWPCLDPDTGLITVAQVALLDDLNAAVEATGYTGGKVSHHGPETQFFESPYVDYPITAFDPGDPNDPEDEGRILAIPRGPKGFRDLHLKRFYEEKIRQGYWLYPNTYKSANWHWEERGKEGHWRGWHYEDSTEIGLGKDTEQIPPPPCVYREIRRRKVAPQVASIECTQEIVSSDGKGKKQKPGEYPDWLPKVGNPDDLPPVSEIPRPPSFYDRDLYFLSAGVMIADGEQKLRDGQYDTAIDRFEAAKKELFNDFKRDEKKNKKNKTVLKRLKDELIKNWQTLNHRITIAKGARDFQKSLNPNASFDNASISETQLEAALAEHERGETIQLAASTFPLDHTKDTHFLLKDMEREKDSEALATEVAAAALAARLGLRVPQATRKEGSNLLVSRYLHPSQELFSLKEHQLFAFRQEYARLRVFRIWVGDFDGHLRNYLKGPDDRPWAIDFDNANLKGTRLERIDAEFPTVEDFLAAVIRYPHGNLPDTVDGPRLRETHNNHFRSFGMSGTLGIYAWQARMDRMIRYRDMKEFVEKIKAFAYSEDLEATLIEAGYGQKKILGALKSSLGGLFKGELSSELNTAVKSLRERADLLKPVLEHYFDNVLLEDSQFLDLDAVDSTSNGQGSNAPAPGTPALKTPLPKTKPMPDRFIPDTLLPPETGQNDHFNRSFVDERNRRLAA